MGIMKKIIALLMVVMMIGLTACGEKDVDILDNGIVDSNEILDTDRTKGEILFDGKVLQFPFKFSELKTMGWQVTFVPEKTDSVEWSNLELKNAKYNSENITVYANFNPIEDGDISDYEVTGIEVMMWSASKDEEKPLVSIDGVVYGDTQEKADECLGKVDRETPKAERYVKTYTYYSEETQSVLATVMVGFSEDEGVKALGMHYYKR